MPRPRLSRCALLSPRRCPASTPSRHPASSGARCLASRDAPLLRGCAFTGAEGRVQATAGEAAAWQATRRGRSAGAVLLKRLRRTRRNGNCNAKTRIGRPRWRLCKSLPTQQPAPALCLAEGRSRSLSQLILRRASADVDVPVSFAYKLWEQREKIPEWMPIIAYVKVRTLTKHVDLIRMKS